MKILDSYMTLAGFFGDKEQWDAFVPDWKNALGQRLSLDMKDIRGWHRNKARIERPLKKLEEVSHSHSLFPIFASLRANDYLDIVSDSQHEFLGYSICLTAIMIALKNHESPVTPRLLSRNQPHLCPILAAHCA